MWWECDACKLEWYADPTGHSDTGGKVVVYGPDCPECGERHPAVADNQEGVPEE